MTWTFRTKENQTRVTLTVDYRVPLTIIGRLTEIIVMKMNEKEAELVLDNLRIKFRREIRSGCSFVILNCTI